AAGARMVGVIAHQRGHVEGGREARLALREQVLEARVRVLGAAEAREHAHGPGPATVHRRIDAPGERILARGAQPLFVRLARQVRRRVERLDRDARERLEPHPALGRLRPDGPPSLRLRLARVAHPRLPALTIRAPSIAVVMSASIHWTIWCWPIGTPKDLRSRAYSSAFS